MSGAKCWYLSFIVASLLLCNTYSSVLQDYDKCTLWLKNDGSSCQASTYFSPHNVVMSFVPSIGLRKVCCKDGTGCFSIEKDSPYECYNDLPHCMERVKPMFYFYTPERSQQVQMIDYNNLNESVQALDTSNNVLPFFAIAHGFGADWPKNWMFNLKDKLVELGNNVLILRWTGGSKDPWYFQSSANTRTVGAALALVMKQLQAAGKLSLSTSTIVGFSLGAQVAGYAGSNLPKLNRIIGLDPAGPMFQCMHPKARLDATDANFVQAIHTHGDYFVAGGCGTLQQFGDMDIYINGGVEQPGCNRGVTQAITEFSRLNFTFMVEAVSCSHNRVPPLFIEMVTNAKDPVNSCKHMAFPCTSTEEWLSGACFECPQGGCPTTGYLTDASAHIAGKFYVNTLGENATSGQYCGRQFLLSLITDKTLKGKITAVFKNSTGQSTPVLFQDSDEFITGGIEKSIVAVVPWQMTVIEEIELLYTKNRILLISGHSSATLTSLSVQNVDGGILSNNTGLIVNDGTVTSIRLSASIPDD